MPKTRSEGQVTSSTPRRNGALIVLNAALLGLLGLVTFNPGAEAQNRVRGEYLMVGGKAGTLNGGAGAVYVVDAVNQEMIALSYDPNTKKVGGIGYRNLAADANTLLSTGSPR